ncbi:hypothetical protein GCM10007989_06310 [Devosia pacifica]|uniref:Activator of Hsp90 ATPase homologue 1/2-like C-terminal domain-containing protein n=1 Tax=Devosia pacifica TaxID=1335967 RepID=A0A918RZ58_9HYPH|nr:SRPBCC domain-containing protein [Devosia pacifica]GHA14375.1 hypothetical protein GCM10007989_06310 [Devosia pacifica]
MTHPELNFECELDASRDKVWRALTIPAYLERWLLPLVDGQSDTGLRGRTASGSQIECEILDAEAPHRLRYRWRERVAGMVEESIVTIDLDGNDEGPTRLLLKHEIPAQPANDNTTTMALAA